jgi:hypothetical protein
VAAALQALKARHCEEMDEVFRFVAPKSSTVSFCGGIGENVTRERGGGWATRRVPYFMRLRSPRLPRSTVVIVLSLCALAMVLNYSLAVAVAPLILVFLGSWPFVGERASLAAALCCTSYCTQQQLVVLKQVYLKVSGTPASRSSYARWKP